MILNILLFDERQGHNDGSSPAWLTLHPDAALMQQYNLLHDGKPHAAAAIFAAVRTVCLKEAFKDPLLILL
ncbi:hypothetical protein D3C73_1481490 [compost metagenome]